MSEKNLRLPGRIAVFAVAHPKYWAQFPTLRESLEKYHSDLCEKLAYMGVKLDPEKNKIRGEEVEISTPDSTVKVFVIPTNEELVIARDTKAIVEALK